MDAVFVTKLIISVVIGGSWVAFVTYIADILGPKVGGLLAGLPSTLIFSLFFIAWTQSPEAAVTATTIVPFLGGISSFFLVIYSAFVHKGLLAALSFALGFWFVAALITVNIQLPDYYLLLLFYVAITIVSVGLVEYVLKVETVKGKQLKYSRQALLIRGALSGSVIGLSVLIAWVGGPLLGGVFALFPAMFTSTLVVSYLSHGREFSRSLAKSALVSSVSIVVYSMIVRVTYVPLGFVIGTLLASLGAMLVGFFLYRVVIVKLH